MKTANSQAEEEGRVGFQAVEEVTRATLTSTCFFVVDERT